MFSQTAEYALRAIAHMALQPDKPQTAQQIAEATQVSAGYLTKVLQSLARAGLVSSQRGLHGGFVMVRRPENLTILEILEAVDPIPRIRSCPLRLPGHQNRLCALHRHMDEAFAAIEESFRKHTIADILLEDAQDEGFSV